MPQTFVLPTNITLFFLRFKEQISRSTVVLRNFLFCLGSSDAVQCLLAYLEVLISDDLGYLEHGRGALSKPEKLLELPAIKNVTESFVLKCMQITQRKHPRVSPRPNYFWILQSYRTCTKSYPSCYFFFLLCPYIGVRRWEIWEVQSREMLLDSSSLK